MGLTVHLVLLSLLALAFTNPERNPDCRKFVFAPMCRGVAAKRSLPIKSPLRNGFLVDASKLKDLLKAYSATSEWINDENTIQESPSHSSKRTESIEGPTFYDYEHVK